MRNAFLNLLLIFGSCFPLAAQFNNLWIPDTLAGPDFNLTIKDTMAQIKPGQQTITGGII